MQVTHAGHGVQRRHGGALVIAGAAAIDFSVFDHRLEGLAHGPLFRRGGDHVQVGQNVQPGGLVAQVCGADPVVIQPGGKALALAERLTGQQGTERTLAIGHVGQRLGTVTLNAAQGRNVFQHGGAVRVEPGSDGILIWHK